MANSYAGNVAYIDTVSSDLDIANLMFGLSTTPINIKGVYFFDPTAEDKIVLKDNSGNVVISMKAYATNQDMQLMFNENVLRCQGLKLVASENTKTTGTILIYFA